jgi:hypothetical protein
LISRYVTKQRTGRRFLTAFAAVGLIAGAMLASGTALAVHNDGLFELDTSSSASVCAPLNAPCGNANTVDSTAAGDDWATIYANGGSANDSTFIADPVSSAENSFYTGGGSKDTRDVPAWAYGTSNDVIPDKDDIADAFAATYTDADSHDIVYFGVDRYDNNGDAETGFWFFQDPVSTNGSGGFTGSHTVGDVLVLADWGGSNPVGQLTVYQWMGGKNPLQLVSDTAAGGADCAKVVLNDNVCAVVNRQTDNPPWPFHDKGGSADIRPLELFEAGLDINALFGGERCFSSFLASTRSSHSVTAQLKDFALGGFQQCQSGIATQVSDTSIEPGGSVTDTATVTVNGPAPTGTVQFSYNFNGGAFSDYGSPVDLETDPSLVIDGDNYSVDSQALSPTVPGTYCFSATWDGDSNYTGGPYTDDGTNECFEVVVFQPTLSTAQTVTIQDTATISDGGGGGDLSGTAHFEAFSAAGCAAADAIANTAEDVPVAGAAPQDASTSVMTITDPGVPTIYWQVSYTSNNPSQADIAATCTENSSIDIND